MSKKPKLKLLLAVGILIASLLPLHGLGEKENQEEKLLKEVYTYIETQYNHSKNDFVLQKLELIDNIWNFVLELKKPDFKTNGTFIGSINKDGDVLELVPPFEMTIVDQVMVRFLYHVNNDRYKAEGFYQFKMEWMEYFKNKDNYIDYTNNLMGREGHLQIVTAEIFLPDEMLMTKEKAELLALEALKEIPLWTEEVIDMFYCMADIYINSPIIGKTVYRFLYRPMRYGEAYFAKGNDMDESYLRYEDKLISFFGGLENIPLYITVSIDPILGEIAQEPQIYYRENDSWYVNFLLE